jgi:hypothetical protein
MTKEEEKKGIVYYCKDCEEIVDTAQVGNKFVYKCKKCGTKNVAFGTYKSIYGFFRIEEKEAKEKRKKAKVEREKK